MVTGNRPSPRRTTHTHTVVTNCVSFQGERAMVTFRHSELVWPFVCVCMRRGPSRPQP